MDVTQESRPPEAPEEAQATVDEPSQGLAGLNAAQWLEQHRQTAAGTESPKAEVSCSAPARANAEPYPTTLPEASPKEESSYAPVRRIVRKTPESSLRRLPDSNPEDFANDV